MFKWLKNIFNPSKNIAVFVDGPNMLRKEFNIDLFQVKKIVNQYGKIKIGRVFLNQYAPSKLVEAVVNQGFEILTSVGDVDVMMAVDIADKSYLDKIDIICIVTRDSDFIPALNVAKRNGKEIMVILVDESSASALKNSADHVIILERGRKVKKYKR